MTTTPLPAGPLAGLLALLSGPVADGPVPGLPADTSGDDGGFAGLVDALVAELAEAPAEPPVPAVAVDPAPVEASADVEAPVLPSPPDALVALALAGLALPVPSAFVAPPVPTSVPPVTTVPTAEPATPVATVAPTTTAVAPDQPAPSAQPAQPAPAPETAETATEPAARPDEQPDAPAPVSTAPAAPAATTTPAAPAAPTTPPTVTGPPAPTATPEVRGAVQHVVDQVTRLVGSGPQGTRSLVLRLDPGSLGEVEVRLRVHAGVVRVHLTAGDAAVREALGHDAGRLHDLLGTSADDVRVVVADLPRPAREPAPMPTPDRPADQGAAGQHHGPSDGHRPPEHGRPTRTSDVTRATDGTQRPTTPPDGATAADPRTTSPRRLDVSA